LNKEAQFKQRNGLTEDAVDVDVDVDVDADADVDDRLGQFSKTECLLMNALSLFVLFDRMVIACKRGTMRMT
jgi:hypothetical protein